mgnify:CR=1 FL=1
MQLKVANRTIDKFNNVSVSLKYDAVGSPFAFSLYFDPASATDKRIFQPGSYNLVEVTHNGETLITGVVLSQGFESSSVKHLTTVAGYSRTGVLEDCTIKTEQNPNMSNVSLAEIADLLVSPFGFKVVIDSNVSVVCDEVIANSAINQYQTIGDYLSSIASQKNVVLSHTPTGDLLLTKANGNKTPIFHFSDKSTWVRMALSFDGQQMHSIINVKGQVDASNPNNSANETELNPYLDNTRFGVGHGGFFPKFRPVVYQQTASTDVATQPLTARKKLGNELKAIRLKIDIKGWTLNNKIPRPGDIVTVTNGEIFLYQKSKWFIEQVDFRGNEKEDVATIYCVLPECYNDDKIVNIFTGTNLTTPYVTPGAKATIVPFDQP